MRLDRQPRGERLATVPEATSLLGKAGGDAASPHTFAARQPPQPRRLLPYAAACMALGLLALYFLGALPVGGSSGAWIRSLPKKRHNPAAGVPQLPRPSSAQLDAAASRLEGGGSQPGERRSGGEGSGDVETDRTVTSGADSSSGGGLPDSSGGSSSAGDSGADGASDAVDSDIRLPIGSGNSAAHNAAAESDVQAQALAPEADAQAFEEVSTASDKRSEAAADPPDERRQDAAAAAPGDAAAQPGPSEVADTAKGAESPAQDSSGGEEPDDVASRSSVKASGRDSDADAPSGTADGPVAGDVSHGESDAAPEPAAASSGAAPGGNGAEAPVSDAGGAASGDAGGSGGRGGGQERDGGSLSRASAPDEAALLADPEAKEAQPDTPADAAADSSDSRAAAPSGEPGAAGAAAQAPAGAGANGSGSSGSGDNEQSAEPHSGAADAGSGASASGAKAQGAGPSAGRSAGKSKPGSGGKAPAPMPGNENSGSSGGGSGGSPGSENSSQGSGGVKGGGGGATKAASSGGSSSSVADGSSPKGKGAKQPAGRKAAAGQRGGSGGERVALATQAAGQGKGSTPQQGCLAFAPAGCQLIPGKREPLRWPVCDNPPGHIIPGGPDCSFDLEAELRPCPIVGGGLYFEHEKPQPGCEVPPFWREGGPDRPSCADGACCSGDGLNGTWQETRADRAYGVVEFQLDESMGCRFHQYTRRQVLGCLGNTTVVFWGDSMVRQLFNRIPALFRGQRRAFDAQTWRAERFEVCEAADVRTHAPTIDGIAPRDGHYRLWGLAELTDEPHPYLALDQVPETELLDLVDPHAKPKVFPGETCGKTRPVSFHYVPATALWEQYRFGGYYLKTHKDISQSIWVVQTGYWDLVHREADEKWLETMEEALDRGIQKMVIITVPTVFVGIDERDPRRWILRDRNDYMRRWAANDTSGRTVILDMDALSMAPNAPTGLLGNWTDWHYSCKFSWVDEHEGRNLTAKEWAPHSNGWLDPSGWMLGGLQPNVRRDCIDDMNLTVLQILFNMLCNKRT